MSLNFYLHKYLPTQYPNDERQDTLEEVAQAVLSGRLSWNGSKETFADDVRKLLRYTNVYSNNITHNLNKMAAEAGVYDVLWRPEEHGIVKAEQIIEPLTKAIELMKADPARFEKHNAPNGWGLYVHFLPWLEEVLEGCIQHPDADVSVSR